MQKMVLKKTGVDKCGETGEARRGGPGRERVEEKRSTLEKVDCL